MPKATMFYVRAQKLDWSQATKRASPLLETRGEAWDAIPGLLDQYPRNKFNLTVQSGKFDAATVAMQGEKQ